MSLTSSTALLTSMKVLVTFKILLIVTSLTESISGFLIFIDTNQLVTASAGILFSITGFMLLYALITNHLLMLSLIQVFTCSYILIFITISIISLIYQLNDHYILGIYFASLFFFIIQSILLNEFIVIKLNRIDYQLISSDQQV